RGAAGRVEGRQDQGADREDESRQGRQRPGRVRHRAQLGPFHPDGAHHHASRLRTSQIAAPNATAAYAHSTPKPPQGLMAVSNRTLVCWMARPATGVSRLIHFSTANDGTKDATIWGTRTRPTTSVIARAERRRIVPTPRLNTASTARNSAVPTTARNTGPLDSDGCGYAGGS